MTVRERPRPQRHQQGRLDQAVQPARPRQGLVFARGARDDSDFATSTWTRHIDGNGSRNDGDGLDMIGDGLGSAGGGCLCMGKSGEVGTNGGAMRTDWTGSGGSANAYTASARLCIDCATSTATIRTIIDAPRVIAVVLEVFGGLGGDVTWPTFCFTQQLGYLSPDRLRHRLRPRKWSATSNISLSMFSSTFGSCVVVSDCQQARIASYRSLLDASLSPVFSLRPVCCSGSVCIVWD